MVDEAWRVVAPAQTSPAVYPYGRTTWGPAEADRVLGGGHGHDPDVPVGA
jgi:hypothetical protein